MCGLIIIIDINGIKKEIVDKIEIIKAEIINSGKSSISLKKYLRKNI